MKPMRMTSMLSDTDLRVADCGQYVQLVICRVHKGEMHGIPLNGSNIDQLYDWLTDYKASHADKDSGPSKSGNANEPSSQQESGE